MIVNNCDAQRESKSKYFQLSQSQTILSWQITNISLQTSKNERYEN